MTTHEFADPDRIEEVLGSDLAAPPPRTGSGATLALRAAMARFAHPAEHPPRRRAVEEAVALLDPTAVGAVASRLAAEVGAGDAARFVPVAAVAAGLGLADPDDLDALVSIVADVDAIVEVIGRGGTPTAGSDAATERLLGLASGHPAGSVAAVSLLYQAMDATAALISGTLDAEAMGGTRPPAVARTVRVALDDASLAGRTVAVGDELVLDIGGAGLEFGAGPHACPGRGLAEAISDAVVTAVHRTAPRDTVR